ncbi:MAG: hypothetical protein AAFV97_00065 [Bacteroidota bacterium]
MKKIVAILIVVALAPHAQGAAGAKPEKQAIRNMKTSTGPGTSRSARARTQPKKTKKNSPKAVTKAARVAKPVAQPSRSATSGQRQAHQKPGDGPRRQPTARRKTAAQEEKDLIKKWQQYKADMEPLQLKDLIEENHRLKTQNRKMDVTLAELLVKLTSSEEKAKAAEKYRSQMQELQHQLDILRQATLSQGDIPPSLDDLSPDNYRVDTASGKVFVNGIWDTRYGVDPQTGKAFTRGVVFRVQISASKEEDLASVLVSDNQQPNLVQEKIEGVNKYTLGHFRNYHQADRLKKGLRNMGITSAWIVPFKDGQRVPLREVLDVVLDQ